MMISKHSKEISSPSAKSRISDEYASVLTNFPISSRRTILSPTNARKQQLKTQGLIGKTKQNSFMINGENFFSDMTVLNKEVEAIEDGYSVKGQYLYIQKGNRVFLTNVIRQFAEVIINGHTGYFPTYIFKHI